jgi:vanZ family protein
MQIQILPMLPDFIVLGCLYYFAFFQRWKQLPKKKLFWYTALYLYICVMMMLTLMPIIIHIPNIFSGFSSKTNFYPFIDWQLQRGDYLTESLLNISLFIPFGFLIRQNTTLKPWQVILIGLFSSIGIEVLQPLLSFDRVSDVSDIITNTIGTCIGVYFYQIYLRKINNAK